MAPLTKLCSPTVPFVWTSECDYAFAAAKSLLCSAPVLAAPNFTLPFQLEVDASGSWSRLVTGRGRLLKNMKQDDSHQVQAPSTELFHH